jgi:hypothetical protein
VRFEFDEYTHEHRSHRDECDATMTLTMLQVQIHGAKDVTNGTMFLAGNDVQIMQGARLHLDRGDLLVTASNFAFGPAPGSLTSTNDSVVFALSFRGFACGNTFSVCPRNVALATHSQFWE